MKPGYTYIMTNKRHTVLYTGCTSDIVRRAREHRTHRHKGSFSDKYNCEYCVYFEVLPDYMSAIKRENQIKNMRRSEKIALINAVNPEWKDLMRPAVCVSARTQTPP